MRLVVVIAGMVLGSGGLAAAGVESVAVEVDGLTCPFCAYGLEKHLKRSKGPGPCASTWTAARRS